MKTSLLYGDGTKQCPYYVQGHRNEEQTSLKGILALCDREGISRLNIAYSGKYWEKQKDGWKRKQN